MESALSLRRLTKTFGSRVAVDGLDLEAPAGSIFGFLGPNGAGKTTTIRMLLGLTAPTSGEASILGHPIPGALAAALAKTGSVLEDPSFYPQMSGRRNLEVLALVANAKDSLRRIDEVLDRVGLKERSEDKVGKYSRGMRQRLALAAALMRDPDVYILDEPSTGLDPPGVRDVRDLLVGLRDAQKTVFFSSHSLSEVERVCDQVAIIQRGKLVKAGQLDSLVPGPPLVRVLVEDPKAAMEVASKRGWEAKQDGEAIFIEGVSPDEVNKALVYKKLVPREISTVKKTLEDAFLELTGDEDES